MTLGRALRAELLRLARDRAPLFWGFAFVPIVYLAFAAAFTFVPMGRLGPATMAVDPLLQAAKASALGGNPIVHLFVAIGAVAIFGGEYRYATWRLIGPRAPRHILFAAKACSFALAAGAGLAVAIAGSALIAWLPSLIGDSVRIEVGVSGGSLAAMVAVGLLELAVFGTLVALAAVTTRAGAGGILPPFCFSLAQALAEATWPPPAAAGPWLGLPTFAADLVRRWAIGPDAVPGSAIAIAIASLVGWMLAVGGLAILLLARQDWARE